MEINGQMWLGIPIPDEINSQKWLGIPIPDGY